jgi:hypothetical protein
MKGKKKKEKRKKKKKVLKEKRTMRRKKEGKVWGSVNRENPDKGREREEVRQ